jgi:Ca-activated chloride channel family protein
MTRDPMYRIFLLTAVLAWCCQTPADTAGQRPRRFRVGIDIVPLNVSVSVGAGRYLTDLTADEFTIFENNRRQRVMFFEKTGAPVSLTLLLDMSSSMRYELRAVQEIAVGCVQALGAADLASVVEFGDSVQVVQEESGDPAVLTAAIRGLRAAGSTPLYSALYVMLKEMQNVAAAEAANGRAARRRGMVVISDGLDTTSAVAVDDVLSLASHTEVAVYTISLGLTRRAASATRLRSDAFLRELSSLTGGRSYFPGGADPLKEACRRVRAELANQYALAYEPLNARDDTGFRRIRVDVSRSGAVARTRLGYQVPGR